MPEEKPAEVPVPDGADGADAPTKEGSAPPEGGMHEPTGELA